VARLPNPETEAWGVRLSLILAILLTICIVRLWLMPLPSSFWLDETATALIVKHGAAHPSLDVAPQVTASVYYTLPRISVSLFGNSEAAHRLPSILAMLAALFLIARIAARLIHPAAAWFAAFASLVLTGMNYQAADARPYALGTCVTAAAFLYLIRWLDSAQRTDGLLFLLFAGLLWHVHLIYWPLYLAFALYAVVRIGRRETRVTWLHAGMVLSALALILSPVLVTTLRILDEAAAHAFAPLPGPRELFNSLKFGLLISAVAVAVCFRWLGKAESGAIGMARLSVSVLTLIAGWWLFHPLCLYAYSQLSGNSVFLYRYLSVALPGGVLAATLVASWLIPASRWKHAALALGAGVLLLMGQWSEAWPRHDISDWRAAADQIRRLDVPLSTPVIVPSPFLEAQSPAWEPDYPLPGFLYAHLDYYPIPGEAVLLPFAPSTEAEQYAAELARTTLLERGRFVIYGGDRNARFWTDWFAKQQELSGWSRKELGPFGNVGITLFERDANAMLENGNR
jgi:mannosyltransferase